MTADRGVDIDNGLESVVTVCILIYRVCFDDVYSYIQHRPIALSHVKSSRRSSVTVEGLLSSHSAINHQIDMSTSTQRLEPTNPTSNPNHAMHATEPHPHQHLSTVTE